MARIVITGASDGIGAAGARRLAADGHEVVVVGRSRAKTEAVAAELGAPLHLADFSRLDDVRRLAAELERYERIDVLVNNAGGVMGRREVTEDGFEKTFQVNHLAPFLLTTLLLPRLVAARAKVIQTASAAANHFGGDFDLDDLNHERRYAPMKAYGDAKLANVLFTRELDRRHRADGIAAVAFHPGVVRSNFASETGLAMRVLYHSPLKYLFMISAETSAKRLSWLVDGEDWEPGGFYGDRTPIALKLQDDGAIARELWDRSERMLAAVDTQLS
ncbi:SDR family NAD(P)-dependent oxidoreductase [Solirubrobacter phytolaccae]|uniref:SDR family NAD(P)-dependent oxidoreductase n=1 Tax=Solirubrobacter phytolaccae TaxID=1404360 RepID=A0A9X3NAU3_9ACTN|nr:SDR family NAD(P)-dependent oxidoreductase [Solirubrobacter phytolaccae]MDA0183205.1 SDR family NAD(P)-dependent oxidoreductase [Solirubrobacter phytolaccae]